MGYSKDFRERAVAYKNEGHTIEETSKVFAIGKSTLNQWLKKYRETGDLSNKPLNRGYKKIDPEKLKKYVQEHEDIIQADMAKEFSCSIPGICKALRRNKITLKKRHHTIRNRTKKK
jgi:transposase